MKDHFKEIYRHKASEYHHLIAAEDVDGNLLRSLKTITPLKGKRILDLGSGTGRIPLLMRGEYASLLSLDLHHDMLREQSRQREISPHDWRIIQADLRFLPVKSASADLVIAAWAMGHFCAWYADDWKRQINLALEEMSRACTPGGKLIIMETMGTGTKSPAAPTPALADYFNFLEQAHGFSTQIVSTDYQFDDLEQAQRLTGFFFGQQLADKVRENNWLRLPEWTAIFTKSLA